MDCIKKTKCRCYLSGVTVVEMSYIIPLCILLFVTIIYTVFYYHDKIVMIGALAETAAVGAEHERRVTEWEYEGEDFLRTRLDGKLILMTEYEVSYETEGNMIVVQVQAERGYMKLKLCQKAIVARPEDYVRWIY